MLNQIHFLYNLLAIECNESGYECTPAPCWLLLCMSVGLPRRLRHQVNYWIPELATRSRLTAHLEEQRRAEIRERLIYEAAPHSSDTEGLWIAVDS